ncbi:MAG: tripartite tricarboxylate transporter TctB family protein [Pseudomonadota bacterium]
MKIGSAAQDFWIGCLLIVICFAAYFVIIPREVQGEIQRGLAPDFFPRLSVIWVGLFSLLILVRCFFTKGRDDQTPETPDEKRMGRKGFIYTILGSILYLILCSLFSFVLSTIFTLVLLMWVLGERRWFMIAAATLVTTFGIYILFGKFMSVQLPEGILF